MFEKWKKYQPFQNWKKASIGIIVVFLCWGTLLSQSNYGQEFDFKDGLPSEIVRRTFIDQKGSVWVGTDAGVGVFPKHNTKNNAIAKIIGSSQVWDICSIHDKIYFATYDSGLFIFDQKLGTLLKRYRYPEVPKIRKFKQIDDQTFMVSNKGIYKINGIKLQTIIRKHPFPNDTHSIPMDIFQWNNQQYVAFFPGERLLTLKGNQWVIANDFLSQFLCDKKNPKKFETIFSSIIYKDKLFCSTGDSRFFSIDKNNQTHNYQFTNKPGSNYVIWDMKESHGNLYMAVGNTENFEQGLLFEFNPNETSENVEMVGKNYFLWSLTVDPFGRGIWASTINHGVFFYPNFEHRVLLPANIKAYTETKNCIVGWSENMVYFKRHHQNKWIRYEHNENIRQILEFNNELVIVSEDGVYLVPMLGKQQSKLIFKNAFEEVFIQNNYLYAVNFFGPIWSYDLKQKKQINHLPQTLKNFHSAVSNEFFTILHSENQGYFLLHSDSLFKLKLDLPIQKKNLKFYVVGTMMYIHEGNHLICCEIDIENKTIHFLDKIQFDVLFPNTKIEWIHGNTNGLWLGNNLMALQMSFNLQKHTFDIVNQFYLGFSKDIQTVGFTRDHITVIHNNYVQRTPIHANKAYLVGNCKIYSEIKRNQPFYHFPVIDQGQNYHFTVESDDYLSYEHFLYEVKLSNSDEVQLQKYFTNDGGVWLDYLERDLYKIDVKFLNQKITSTLMVNNPIFKRTEFWIYIFMSTMILFFILYRQQKNSFILQQKILSLELSTIRSNMNPHFVFNVMNFVQAMIVKSDQKMALKATSDLAHLNRLFLETSNKEIITLKSELSLARKYVNLEKLRFENDRAFDFTISVEKNVDTTAWFLPPLLLQPLLENALKHGVLLLDKKVGKIKIFVLQIAPNEIDILIQNSGKNEQTKRIGGTGMGQKLVKDRILLFNRKFYKEYNAEFSHQFDGDLYNCHLTIRKLT